MKKNKTILIFTLSFLTNILVVGLFVFCLQIIKNKNQHISVVTATIQEKMQQKENATLFAEKVTEIQTLKESIDKYFMDSNKVDLFVGYLEDISVTTGAEVSVRGIEVSKEDSSNISFKLSIVGSFQDVMESIGFLENIPYQVDISQVYLNKNIDQELVNANNKTILSKISTWQADVSFNILSSN